MTDHQLEILNRIKKRQDFLEHTSKELHNGRAVEIEVAGRTYSIYRSSTLGAAFTSFIDKQLAETESLLSNIVIDVSAADASTAVQLLNQLKEEGLI